MRISRSCRTFAAAAWAVTCAALSACGGENGRAEDLAGDSRTAHREPAPTTAAASDSITVVLQLTGLMLVVPPTQDGGTTDVTFPTVTSPTHVAGIAFGADSTRVCERYDRARGICFVNLASWRLDAIAPRGRPTKTPVAFPAGVEDVSHGSGNHRVDINAAHDSVSMQVAFLSGAPLREPACRLAKWNYQPVGQSTKLTPLVNLMRWDIRHPRTPGLVLRFNPTGSGPAETVPLNQMLNDTVRVLLAHVPQSEWDSIIANRPTTPAATTELTHFHDYYKLLRHPSTGAKPPVETNRPLPHFSEPTGEGQCPVRITARNSSRVIVDTSTRGVGTYACVVVTGG